MRQLLILVLILTANPFAYGQKREGFDSMTVVTTAAASVSTVMDCEYSQTKQRELNPLLGRNGRPSRAACYGLSAAIIGGSLVGERLAPKHKRLWNGLRLGVTGGHTVGVIVSWRLSL